MPPIKRITSKTNTTATKSSHHRPSKWMLTFILFGLMVAVANAVDEKSTTETKSVQPSSSPASSSVTARDEIYIDDEGIEGSGGRGEIHDDLEKEPDYSGSGFGPDDEDSSTGHHHSSTHTHHSPSFVPDTSSGSRNTIGKDSTNRKETGSTHVTEYDLGGGVAGSAGETISSKDVSKTNNDIDLDIDHTKLNNNNNLPTDPNTNTNSAGNEVFIMNTKDEGQTTSFFAQPGILAAVIGGAVVGLLCAILVVMFIVYRMRKKDEGSYALDEPKRSPAVNSYAKNANNREFYA